MEERQSACKPHTTLYQSWWDSMRASNSIIEIILSTVAWSFKYFNYSVFTHTILPFLLKVILSTIAFTAFELPPNGAIGTRILEFLFHAKSDLVSTLFWVDIFNMHYIDGNSESQFILAVAY